MARCPSVKSESFKIQRCGSEAHRPDHLPASAAAVMFSKQHTFNAINCQLASYAQAVNSAWPSLSGQVEIVPAKAAT